MSTASDLPSTQAIVHIGAARAAVEPNMIEHTDGTFSLWIAARPVQLYFQGSIDDIEALLVQAVRECDDERNRQAEKAMVPLFDTVVSGVSHRFGGSPDPSAA